MDERPMEVMQKTLKVIRKADPDFKVSLAGNYHAEIEPDLYDYCIVIGQNFPEEVRLRRVAENKRTNYYTCCTEAHPNTFTFSDPAEAVWISYYSSKETPGRLFALGIQQLAIGTAARFPFPQLGRWRYVSCISGSA